MGMAAWGGQGVQEVMRHPRYSMEPWGDMKPRDATAADDDMESRQTSGEGVFGNWGVTCA